MTEEELQQLKDELKKEPVKEKKVRQKRSPKGFMPYFLVFVSFSLSIILLYFILDKLLMPSFVSDREIVEMPLVQGLNIEDAKMKLLKKNLHVSVSGREINSEFPADIILRQTPKQGKMVKSGRTVFLTLSKGPDSIKVPYLIGHDIRRASVLLMRRGLELGDTLHEYSMEYKAKAIIQQSLKPGSMVPYGSEVDIIVSNGPEDYIEVPQLIGVELNDLRKLLNESGLEMGSVSYIEDETYLPFTVGAQNPKAGERVPAGTLINVSVYIEPPKF